jgi:hypothetical protein
LGGAPDLTQLGFFKKDLEPFTHVMSLSNFGIVVNPETGCEAGIRSAKERSGARTVSSILRTHPAERQVCLVAAEGLYNGHDRDGYSRTEVEPMMTPVLRARLATTTIVLALTIVSGEAAADQGTAARAPGELWEVTSQMSMENMPMALPGQKVKTCAPKEWKEPPGGADERSKCSISDFKIEGAKVTWKVSCAGPPAMTGDGEITREGPDSWSGAIKLASEEGAVTIKLDGRRLGECEKPQ